MYTESRCGKMLWNAVLIVLLLLLIFLWFWSESDRDDHNPRKFIRRSYRRWRRKGKKVYDRYFASPGDLFRQTVGYENDEAAQLSLHKALAREKKYKQGLKQGDIWDAAENSFVLANLYQFNIAPNEMSYEDWLIANDQAATFYDQAVQRIDLGLVMRVPTTERRNNDAMMPPEFILNRAEDFYAEYLAELRARRPELMVQAQERMPDFAHARENLREVRLREAAQQAQKQVQTGDLDTAGTTLRELLRTNYYEVKEVPDDPQNVHDTEVNDELRAIFHKLRTKNQEAEGVDTNLREISFHEVEEAVKQHKFASAQERDDALRVLNRMNNNFVVSQYEIPEKNVLLEVWKRVNSPENAENREGLRDSFMDALASGIDRDYAGQLREVCTNGRCSRVLNSLTLLDKDEEIARPIKTVEILRNEILQRTHNFIQEELKKAPTHLADAYNGKVQAQGELVQQVEQFEDKLRQDIADTLKEEYKQTRPEVLENLIKDAQAGV